MSERFLSTDALAAALGREGLVILDARPMMHFIVAHIPGSLQVDWKAFSDPRADSKGILHPDVELLAQKVGALGIGPASRVVCYSDPVSCYGEDGRLYWMLSHLGQRDVSILNGGWAKWHAEGRPVERGRARAVAPAPFTAALRPELLMERAELKARVAANDASLGIIDARSPRELASGRVPGAVNIPWNGFYNADGTIKPPGAIVEALKAQGIGGRKDYVVYCAGGVRSAWLYALMVEAGIPNVKNYAGSWSDWSSDSSAPVQR
jgi:thiosulfate/3-mercaptopyruvate sulfurtransferase